MQTFQDFGLIEPIQNSLHRLNITEPTPIQSQSIPIILEGKDVLASAQTGTGKTFAFAIPMLQSMLSSSKGTALIVTPTRELATQVAQAINSILGKKSKLKTAVLIGGESIFRQLTQLRARPRIFIGTPGRLNDHLTRGSLMLHDTKYLVLDETDRMLDMGFSIQIKQIMRYLPNNRQTVLFSATIPNDILSLANSLLKDPVRIAIGPSLKADPKINQEILHVSEEEKFSQLLTQIEQREGSIIIFMKTKFNADKMAKKLRALKHSADAIHGDLAHSKRGRVIKGFRNKEYRILAATDIAARGLDIPHIEHVINYDLPQSPEDYVHRIGRTARAGAEGCAVCFVTPKDRGKWRAIQLFMNPDMKDKAEKTFKKRGGANLKNPSGNGGKPFRLRRQNNKFSKVKKNNARRNAA